jgi:hypothetical protein
VGSIRGEEADAAQLFGGDKAPVVALNLVSRLELSNQLTSIWFSGTPVATAFRRSPRGDPRGYRADTHLKSSGALGSFAMPLPCPKYRKRKPTVLGIRTTPKSR